MAQLTHQQGEQLLAQLTHSAASQVSAPELQHAVAPSRAPRIATVGIPTADDAASCSQLPDPRRYEESELDRIANSWHLDSPVHLPSNENEAESDSLVHLPSNDKEPDSHSLVHLPSMATIAAEAVAEAQEVYIQSDGGDPKQLIAVLGCMRSCGIGFRKWRLAKTVGQLVRTVFFRGASKGHLVREVSTSSMAKSRMPNILRSVKHSLGKV